jgi:hypothetical protein
LSAPLSRETSLSGAQAATLQGVYAVFGDLGGKRIGLLHELLPRATTLAALICRFGIHLENLGENLKAAADLLLNRAVCTTARLP